MIHVNGIFHCQPTIWISQFMETPAWTIEVGVSENRAQMSTKKIAGLFMLLGIFPKEWGTQCPVKKIFFEGRDSLESVLAGDITILLKTYTLRYCIYLMLMLMLIW